MAAGVVSGVVADLLQKSPSLTPDQVKARLMKTAWKSFPAFSSTTDPTSGITYTDQYDVFTIGAGYIDVEAAFKQYGPGQGDSDVSDRVVRRDLRQRISQRQSNRGLEYFSHVVECSGVGNFAVRDRSEYRSYNRWNRERHYDSGQQRSLGQ